MIVYKLEKRFFDTNIIYDETNSIIKCLRIYMSNALKEYNGENITFQGDK